MFKDISKAREQLDLSRTHKGKVASVNKLAEMFTEHDHNNYEDIPTNYLTTPIPEELPTKNLIRFGIRVWLAVVMGAPFSDETLPSGSRDPGGVKKMTADALNLINQTMRSRPDSKDMLRRLATDSLVANAAFLYDGMDFISRDYPVPFKKIISWRDAFVEPAASNNINCDDGPAWVAVRLWIHEDEKEILYGKRGKDMKAGLLSRDSDVANTFERKMFDDLYPVIHWWGIDREYVTFTLADVRRQINESWDGILNGTAFPTQEEPHDDFVEIGDEKFLKYVETRYDQTISDNIETILGQMMLAQIPEANGYYNWRRTHLIMGQTAGSKKRRKYPDGSIYHCEFQEDADDLLLDPEPSPYKHGQIPISFFRRQEGQGFWVKSVMAEAIDQYRYIHYLQQSENVHLAPQARPFMYALRESLAPEYRDPVEGLQRFVDDIGQNKVMMLENATGIDPSRVMGFIQPGAISMDVATRLRENISSLMELFGASEVMRGMGPGAEASGKHIELKMSAATRPSTFMLSMLEGPYTKYRERENSNIIQYADERWLSQMVGDEYIAAIKQVRELPDYGLVSRINLGSGMPTEWVDRFGIWMQLLSIGYPGTPQSKILAKEMGIAIPNDAELMEIMKQTQMMMPTQQPGQAPQPGSPQGTENINYGA